MAKNIPEPNEIVIGRVTRVLDYGAFLELLEYEGISGFVHIAQVSTGWVKNIRAYVKEGQVRAAQVLHIDHERGQIELSLSKVSQGAQRAKIEQFNFLKRSQKMLEVYAKDINVPFEKVWEGVAIPLMNQYDTLQEAFEQVAIKGEEALGEVDPKLRESFIVMVRKNVSIPEKMVRGIFTLESKKPNGIEIVKTALTAGQKASKGKVEMYAVGSGKYDVKVSTHDFKESEKVLRQVSEIVLATIKKEGGIGKFEKVEA